MDERARQSFDAMNRLLDQTSAWLSEIGSWIFGGLVAVNLVVISALLTVGPVDAAVRISVTLFACALHLNVVGLVVLRLTKDLMDLGMDDLALKSFQESGFPEIDAYFPSAQDRAALLKRRSGVALRYSLAIAALSTGVTLAGLSASLWHMAWWIGSVFMAMIALSVGLMVVVLARAQPPESAWEKAVKGRAGEQRLADGQVPKPESDGR